MPASKTTAEYIGRVSPKGQVTLPVEIRNALGLRPKDRVTFQFKDGVLTMRPTGSSLRDSFQSVPALTRNLTDSEVTEIAAEEAAQEANSTR